MHSDQEYPPVYRQPSHYNPLDTFKLPSGQERHYQQQYGDMYFLRLAKLKPAVEKVAVDAWEGFSVIPLPTTRPIPHALCCETDDRSCG
jgi:DNA polymerase delta subunit 2